jgi:hypothetical protein
MFTHHVPREVVTPAMILCGKTEVIMDRAEFDDIVSRSEALRCPSRTVRIQWANGEIEKRTVRVAKFTSMGDAIRGSSAKMSPPNPAGSGNAAPKCFYYDLMDALASHSRGEYFESARAVIEQWRSTHLRKQGKRDSPVAAPAPV